MRRINAAVRVLTLGVLMAVAGSIAAQQVYPSKPIRYVVPYPPGGATDPIARMVAQKLADKWGQSVIVDNRPGGNTIIGTEFVARSPPDGHTVLQVGSPFVIGPSLVPYLPYDTLRDFDAVATIARSRHVLVIHPSLPANSLAEFIALAKAKPGQLNYATSGVGGSLHLATELFNVMADVKTQHIPYKGSGPLLTDLLGGLVQLSIQTPIVTIPHIRNGRLRAIAITGERRLSSLPKVPTFAEAGLPGYETGGWYGIVVPASTPKAVIDKMSAEIRNILRMPDTLDYLANQGMDSYASTPDEFAAMIRTQIGRYANLIKAANIKIEN